MINETCRMSVEESELYPECVVIIAMVKKPERESQNVVTGVQGDTDDDMTFSETMYSDCFETVPVETLLLYRVWCQD